MKLYTNYPEVERIRSLPTLHSPKNIILKMLIFLAVFYCAQIAQSFVMIAFYLPDLFKWIKEEMDKGSGQISSEVVTEKINNFMMNPNFVYIMLLCTTVTTACVLLYVRFVEGRKPGTIGFRKEGAVKQYLIGLGVGFVMFSLVVIIGLIDGGLKWEGFKGGNPLIILLVLLGFGLQGMSEEVTCRGYFMTTIMRHQNVWWAVGINAVFFGIMHCGNNGFSAFALVNLILFGVFASVYALRTDNLWGACAIHSIWNFVQGNFYGLPVSGIDSGDTVFATSLSGSNALFNGGDFGLEASIGTTIVLTAGILILLFVKLPFAVNEPKQETAQA